MSARIKLNSVYTTLPAAEKKVADFILSDPETAAHLVINEIAEKANVSIPSVTRLARKLGYSSFMDFRVALANSGTGIAYDKYEPILSTDSDEQLIKKLMVGHIRAIEATLESLDHVKLAELAQKLNDCRRIVWFAVDNSCMLVSAVSELLSRMGMDSIVVKPSCVMANFAKKLGNDDVAFAVTRTGKTLHTLEGLRIAKNNGASTALMTNLANSPGEKLADYFICTSRLDELYRICGYETSTSMQAVLETLITLIAKKRGFGSRSEFISMVTAK